MIYKSKIGVWLIIILVMAIVPGFYLAFTKHEYSGLPVQIIVGVFVVHLIVTTRYIVEGSLLRVKSGFIINKKIDIKTIKKIAETYNPISSPAASLDRLYVYYNQGSIILSPRDKKGFIAHLQAINPDIFFVPRNKKG